MLTTADGTGFLGDGIFRGNWEFLGEVFGGGIFSGPGDVLAGVDIYLRYNFVQPNSKIVPFIQVGGGGVYSDAAHDDPIQHNIGSDWSFVLEAEIGVRYHFSPRLALTTGVEYRHISNADTSDRNQGLNSIGGVIGLSLFF
jgi:lipid A 3-O-deacylase